METYLKLTLHIVQLKWKLKYFQRYFGRVRYLSTLNLSDVCPISSPMNKYRVRTHADAVTEVALRENCGKNLTMSTA